MHENDIKNQKSKKPEIVFFLSQKGEITVGLYLLSYSSNIYYNNPYPFFSSFFPQKIGKNGVFLVFLDFWISDF